MAPVAVSRAVLRWLLLAPVVFSHGWDYVQNGDDWVREGLGLCSGSGRFSKQSPIDLSMSSVTPVDLRKLYLKYPPFDMSLKLYNNGHALAFTLPEVFRGGFGFVPSESDLQSETADVYRAWQISFHSPSEHTMAGRRLPLEMQIVHQRVTGPASLAVVSVLFEDDQASPSPFLDALISGGLPKEPWQDKRVNFVRSAIGSSSDDHLGLQALLAGSPFFAYEGSLTTPPCETGVNHFVRMQPRTASADQLRDLSDVLLSIGGGSLGNYRRQPRNSTAGNVIVVGAVDTIGGKEASATDGAEYAKDVTAIKGSSASAAREAITLNPQLQRIQYSDSKELQRVKEKYKTAQISQAAAAQSKEDKLQALQQLEARYNEETGSVMKIQLKAEVAAAQLAVTTATEALKVAVQELDAAAIDLLETWRGAQGRDPVGIAKLETTTALPTEFGSAKVATTAVPHVEGQVWGTTTTTPGVLVYPGPTVLLPRGLAASPFVADGMPATAVSIAKGSNTISIDSSGNVRLAPNLRQLDGPEGAIPMAYRSGTELLQGARAGRDTHQRGMLRARVQQALKP